MLYEEARELGYRGSISQLRRYVASLKPVATDEPLHRFETEPGHQVQVDFVVFRRGVVMPLSAFMATLGYSRVSFVAFVTDERLETLMGCHARAFDYFGGVPRQALCDNMKTVVLARDAYGPGRRRFHPEFLEPIAYK